MVNDRDPTPIRQSLADLTGVEPTAVDPLGVRHKSPDAWELTTVRP
ncbi:hypothetical protein [Halapricum desulfuricans]|uniref:Mrp family protein, ATPase, contains iron-sulfurcluster n=1 Tax=Halapricum desulfuricans TaxID=2841257 RepID=A0A897MV45_9EURY|nr:hypothetical protein [Halapricum desulfuricans]QSG04432.1 Mrp family protein, ATPase, contains iron-sulfurcluster [Halapricum desulfuricans]